MDSIQPRHEQHIFQGVVFTILAAISYTIMSLLGKIIGSGASTATILFVRFFISLILILPWILSNIQEIKPVGGVSSLISRSIFSFLAFGSFFYSLKYISLTDALLLNNTVPLFIPLVAWCLLRTKTPSKMWIGIILGFIGIVLVLNPDPQLFHPMALIALASGIFAAIAIVIIRTLTKKTSIIQILFYNFLICSVISALLLPLNWVSLSWKVFFLLLAVGICGGLYQLFSTISFAKAPVRVTSSLMFLCIVFGAIADFVIWKITPTPLSIGGMVCVIIGGMITIYFGKKEIHPNK